MGGIVRDSNDKPVRGATVTAGGLESAPGTTDTDGRYTLNVKVTNAQPIGFRVEHKEYEPVYRLVAVATTIPINFKVRRLKEKVPAKRVITSLRDGLKKIDPVYPQLDCQSPPCPPSNRHFDIQLKDDIETNDQITFVNTGLPPGTRQSIAGSISALDLEKLSDSDKILLIAYDEIVQDNFDSWTTLRKQLEDANITPAKREAISQGLAAAATNMCNGFDGTLRILKGVNLTVWDHYLRISDVCRQYVDLQRKAH